MEGTRTYSKHINSKHSSHLMKKTMQFKNQALSKNNRTKSLLDARKTHRSTTFSFVFRLSIKRQVSFNSEAPTIHTIPSLQDLPISSMYYKASDFVLFKAGAIQEMRKFRRMHQAHQALSNREILSRLYQPSEADSSEVIIASPSPEVVAAAVTTTLPAQIEHTISKPDPTGGSVSCSMKSGIKRVSSSVLALFRGTSRAVRDVVNSGTFSQMGYI